MGQIQSPDFTVELLEFCVLSPLPLYSPIRLGFLLSRLWRGAISTGEPMAFEPSIPSARGNRCTRGPSAGPSTVSTLPNVCPPVTHSLAPSLGAFPSNETRRPPSWDSLETLPSKLTPQPRRLPYMRAATTATRAIGTPAAGRRPPSSPPLGGGVTSSTSNR